MTKVQTNVVSETKNKYKLNDIILIECDSIEKFNKFKYLGSTRVTSSGRCSTDIRRQIAIVKKENVCKRDSCLQRKNLILK